jgi:hypothetical protein
MHKYRAAGDVRTVVNKNKLKIAEPGSVSFNFDRVGLVSVQTDKDEDAVSACMCVCVYVCLCACICMHVCVCMHDMLSQSWIGLCADRQG